MSLADIIMEAFMLVMTLLDLLWSCSTKRGKQQASGSTDGAAGGDVYSMACTQE